MVGCCVCLVDEKNPNSPESCSVNPERNKFKVVSFMRTLCLNWDSLICFLSIIFLSLYFQYASLISSVVVAHEEISTSPPTFTSIRVWHVGLDAPKTKKQSRKRAFNVPRHERAATRAKRCVHQHHLSLSESFRTLFDRCIFKGPGRINLPNLKPDGKVFPNMMMDLTHAYVLFTLGYTDANLIY